MANIEQKFREACLQSGLASMLNQLNNAALNGLISATLNILKQTASGNSITGVIKSIGKTVNVSKQKEFLKRDIILDCSRYNPDDGTRIENYVQMSFTQKRCDDLDGFAVGEKVEVKFRLGGREWQGKVINDVTAYAIERVDASQPAQAPRAASPAPQPAARPSAVPMPPQGARQPAYGGQAAPAQPFVPQPSQQAVPEPDNNLPF